MLECAKYNNEILHIKQKNSEKLFNQKRVLLTGIFFEMKADIPKTTKVNMSRIAELSQQTNKLLMAKVYC
jgi:hypothetical protein